MKKLKLRNLNDTLATRAITAGGMALIVIILGIMSFILYQTLPLWYPADVRLLNKVESSSVITGNSRIVFTGEEEQKEILYLITEDGIVHFISLHDQKVLKSHWLQNIRGQKITSAASSFASHRIALGTDHGRVEQIDIKFNSLFETNGRTIVPELTENESYQLDSLKRPIVKLVYERTEGLPRFVGLISNGGQQELIVASVRESDDHTTNAIRRAEFSDPALRANYLKFEGSVSSLEYNPVQDHLLLGFTNGQIQRWDLQGQPHLIEKMQATDGADVAVLAMEYLIGDVTLIVGDAKGRVNGWMEVKKTPTALLH